jgi:hypothetical protein
MTCIFSKVMIGLINAEVKLVDMGLPVRPLSLDGKTFSDIGRTLDISLYEDLVKTLPAGTERAALGVTWKGDPAVFIFDKNGEVRVQGETVIFMQPEGDDSIDTYIERVVKMNELLAFDGQPCLGCQDPDGVSREIRPSDLHGLKKHRHEKTCCNNRRTAGHGREVRRREHRSRRGRQGVHRFAKAGR